MIDRFEELLNDLGKVLSTHLEIDENQSCMLLINDSLNVQLEMQREGKYLIVGSYVTLLEPGRFREDLLFKALISNAERPKKLGVLGYNSYSNHLTLHDFLDIESLNGENLTDYLILFTMRAMEWKNAVISGDLSGLTESKSKEPPPPMGTR